MRHLALDVGGERIGVAISDGTGLLARPLEMIRRVSGASSFLRIVEIVNQEKIEEAYLDTHNDLAMEVQDYFETYRDSKTKIFDIVSNVIKRKKQKRLLN